MNQLKGFQSESDLVEATRVHANLPNLLGYEGWVSWEAYEVEGLFGVPDLVMGFVKPASEGRQTIRTVSFEMKIQDWKRALVQAFRYSAFSQYSYVIMDRKYVGRAERSIDKFINANIGLISVSSEGDVLIHWKPRIRSPYSASLREKLKSMIAESL